MRRILALVNSAPETLFPKPANFPDRAGAPIHRDVPRGADPARNTFDDGEVEGVLIVVPTVVQRYRAVPAGDDLHAVADVLLHEAARASKAKKIGACHDTTAPSCVARVASG